MFKFLIKRLPWRGEEVKAKLVLSGREGARQAAEYVAERARFYAPVDTGELRASIIVQSSQAGGTWHVLATAPHSRFVEWGSMHGNTFIPPNPFMRRALMDGRRAYPSILKEAMVRAMPGQHLGATFSA
jgi:HK97 gp10 family phage protein